MQSNKEITTREHREFKIVEARLHDEINILWIPGKTNPVDIFTKEEKKGVLQS